MRRAARTIATLLTGALACLSASAPAQDAPTIEMWRLDCGTLEISDVESFSDTHLYDGQPKTLTDSCYLIRHGERHLLWDAGLIAAVAGAPMTQGVYTISIGSTLVEQLAELGLAPGDIDMVGISHRHFDHIGQAASFPQAELLIGSADAQTIAGGADADAASALAPWFGEGATGKLTPVTKDKDIFGDGSVTMLAMPGHTDGHSALLVRLPQTGPVMLTGDLYHFTEQVENRGVPQFNSNRADTLASMDRFDRMAANLGATIVIQHEASHIARLPAFPESAK